MQLFSSSSFFFFFFFFVQHSLRFVGPRLDKLIPINRVGLDQMSHKTASDLDLIVVLFSFVFVFFDGRNTPV